MQRTLQIEHLVGYALTFRKIAGCNNDIGLRGGPQCSLSYLAPVAIQNQVTIVTGIKIASRVVIMNVLFEKVDSMAQAVQSADDGTVGCGMAVAPGGGDCQPKESNLHRGRVLALQVAAGKVHKSSTGMR